uniref:TIR domain-containing protein n=1 Tax=Blastomonas sp. TaxID=1909299 RepID=UPI00258FBC47
MESEFPIIKAFISYAWSSDSHEAWVLDLASRLTADGVTVILDKWDLKVGHDANAFMEQMVTDQSVTKVLMICDKVYKEKADGRMGGVGKETTILTADIYDRTEQDKYAALLTEYDNNGKGFVPAFYGGRQYIDFADDRRIEESYQELLRWIYGKPKFVRPKLGRAPSFITQPDALVTSTTSKFKAAEYAIHKNERQAAGYIVDFGEAMVAEFRSLRAVRSDTEPFDEVVLKSAEAMRPAL